MIVTCVTCKAKHDRPLGSTWCQNQCDDCIVRWAYDKAVKEADKAITDGCHTESVLRWHANKVAQWKQAMQERGLL